MPETPPEKNCPSERRDCANTVQDLAKTAVRQMTITEERVIPTLDRVEAALSRGEERMNDHSTRLVKVEEYQKSARTWTNRRWVMLSVLSIGVVLAVVRSYLG